MRPSRETVWGISLTEAEVKSHCKRTRDNKKAPALDVVPVPVAFESNIFEIQSLGSMRFQFAISAWMRGSLSAA